MVNESSSEDRRFGPGSDTHEAAQKLSQDVGQIRDDLAGLAHDTAAAARAGMADARAGVQDALDSAKAAGAESIESLRKYIEDHPLASTGIAIGVGVLLGMALCRRSSG